MQIHLPFLPRFHQPILRGKKTMTCRTKRYGDPGDWFYVQGRRFVIDLVDELYLRDVAREHYQEEGCATPSEFIAIWNEIHPHRGYRGNDVVIAHHFHYEP